MSDFKQCPNGHYYHGDHCPYCKPSSNASDPSSMKTEIFGGAGETVTRTTEATTDMGGTRTINIDNGPATSNPSSPRSDRGGNAPMSGRTVFGDDDETEIASTPTGERAQQAYREARRLVGWLVSYTLDPMGVDFKLYEGRNIIGRDMDCNITINDPMVSAKHAVLLFRSGKYSITDSQSSHGTFVNDTDIELEPRYLQDGDIIRIGQTLLKFRTPF